MQSICQAFIIGNLTRDPEVSKTPGGTPLAKLRLAYNTREKDQESEEWSDRANYIDVAVFGRQAETVGQFLQKGRPVGVIGRLEWREWTGSDGARRQGHTLVAHQIQFLGGRPDGASDANSSASNHTTTDPDGTQEPLPATSPEAEDDIPF